MTTHRRNISVLITDAHYKHTLGAVRYLGREKFNVDGIGYSRSLSRWSRFLRRIVYPREDFCREKIETFIRFLSQTKYDVFLPIGARSVLLASTYKDEISRYCSVPVPGIDTVKMCMDKDKTYAFAREIGVPVPGYWDFSSLKELEKHMNELEFPLVVKERSEAGENRPAYVFNNPQLLAVLKNWNLNESSTGEKQFPLLQRYIEGTGYGFFALYKEGECKRIFMHKRIRELPPSGGPSCCAQSIFETDLKDQGKKLLDALKWHGVAMVEFKRDTKTGKLYLMEINPKFWGSLDLALAGGVNFPVLDVCMALGEDIPYREEYKTGLKYHWPLHGDIRHVLEKPRAFFPVLWDCLNPKVRSNLWLTDPLPTLYSLYSESKYILGRLLGKHKNHE